MKERNDGMRTLVDWQRSCANKKQAQRQKISTRMNAVLVMRQSIVWVRYFSRFQHPSLILLLNISSSTFSHASLIVCTQILTMAFCHLIYLNIQRTKPSHLLLFYPCFFTFLMMERIVQFVFEGIWSNETHPKGNCHVENSLLVKFTYLSWSLDKTILLPFGWHISRILLELRMIQNSRSGVRITSLPTDFVHLLSGKIEN